MAIDPSIPRECRLPSRNTQHEISYFIHLTLCPTPEVPAAWPAVAAGQAIREAEDVLRSGLLQRTHLFELLDLPG